MSTDRELEILRLVTEHWGGATSDLELRSLLDTPHKRAAFHEQVAKIYALIHDHCEQSKIKDAFAPHGATADTNEKPVTPPNTAESPSADAVTALGPSVPAQDCSASSPSMNEEDGRVDESSDGDASADSPPASEPNSPIETTVGTLEKPEPSTAAEKTPMVYRQPAEVRFRLPNARVGLDYDHAVEQISGEPASVNEIRRLDVAGLAWNAEAARVSGIPTIAGIHKVVVLYTPDGEMDPQPKDVDLTVIDDPKNLWKDIPSNPGVPFWKADNFEQGIQSDRYVLVGASRRGRSHAHEGICRDDDFCLTDSNRAGWRVIAVSDGAGSSKYSREGSRIAAETSSDLLSAALDDRDEKLMPLLEQWYSSKSEEAETKLQDVVYNAFSRPIYNVLENIHDLAKAEQSTLRDFYATLMVAAHKEIGGRHYVLGYWRGDGAMALLEEGEYLNILGSPDGGEYAGQTRFMDNAAVAQEDIRARIKFDVVDEMSALLLMTDGISDPEFESEKEFEDQERWSEYWSTKVKPHLSDDAGKSAESLLSSLDFWSPGNHDDRTIAVLYKRASGSDEGAPQSLAQDEPNDQADTVSSDEPR